MTLSNTAFQGFADMTVKKAPGRDPRRDPTHPASHGFGGSHKRYADAEAKDARLSLRLHSDLREALEFLAGGDRRPLSSYIELMLIDHVSASFATPFLVTGERDPADKGPLRLRTAPRHR
jgi:hypothetical protein